MVELLTPEQMYKADRLTIDGGHAGIDLMETAGRMVANKLLEQYRHAHNVLVICGGGNNGGDGYVIARLLAQSGLNIELYAIIAPEKLRGDAALARQYLGKDVNLIDAIGEITHDVVVDALFGAGLDRPIEGSLATLIESVNSSGVPVVSVDLPSGINGGTGEVMGCAFQAEHTVTFFRKKPGHVLLPGRQFCGEVSVAQIGIRDRVLDQIRPDIHLNRPQLWRDQYPVPGADGHKFNRGHSLVISGPLPLSGAARLTAGAALRSGSGLVTIACDPDVLRANAAALKSIMLCETGNNEAILHVLRDQRINTIAMGPGLDPDANTRELVLVVLGQQRNAVLDAGALSAFADHQDQLFEAIKASEANVVITPHKGEFNTLFPALTEIPGKVAQTQKAARQSGAIVVYKGADSVVCAPDGAATISDNAPPWLATAGSGDVLTGIIAGLLAQGMDGFDAANAAVWLHGDAARIMGPALISSDLDKGLRESIAGLLQKN